MSLDSLEPLLALLDEVLQVLELVRDAGVQTILLLFPDFGGFVLLLCPLLSYGLFLF